MVSAEKMEEIIEFIDGTCISLPEACSVCGVEYDDLSDSNLQALDDSLFQCEGCGWWCDLGEQNESVNGDNICNDCLTTEREEHE